MEHHSESIQIGYRGYTHTKLHDIRGSNTYMGCTRNAGVDGQPGHSQLVGVEIFFSGNGKHLGFTSRGISWTVFPQGVIHKINLHFQAGC